ncbi:hypothetical protein GCM10027293_09300 [Pontibacter aydingkolensis]
MQGEKVQAQINDLNWDRNPLHIEVKVNSASAVQKLTVKDIKDFSLSTGDKYERYIVDVDKSPVELNQLKLDDLPLIERDTVFLKTLVTGNAELYYLKDGASKEHYFLKTGDETPLELIYKVTLLENESGTSVSRVPIYKGMLSAKLTACNEISEKISKVPFKMNALMSLVEDYNTCTSGTTNTYTAKKQAIKHNIVTLAGGTFTTLDFTGTDYPNLIGKDFKGTNYTVGVSLLSTLPRARAKWAIRNDLMFKPLKAENKHETGNNSGQENYTSVHTKFDIGYAGLNTSVRYNILDASIKPYVSLGVSYNLMVYNNSTQETYRRYYGIENTRQEEPMKDYAKHEPALFFSLGLSTKRILAEGKFEKGSAFSPYVYLGSSRSTFAFQVGYILK